MKFSFFLISFALSMSASLNAQTFVQTSGSLIKHSAINTLKSTQKQPASNQRYVGNDIKDNCNTGLGITGKYTGTFKCGGLISKDLLENYIGCKIVGMRFYLCEPVGKSTAFVNTVASNGYINDSPLLSKDLESTQQGWNDVLFDNPYTIGESKTLRGFLAGYTFEQVSDGNPNTPIAVSGTGTTMGFMIYGNLDQGLTWYNMGTSEGALMTQLLIEREGGFLAYDISIDQLLPEVLYSKPGEKRSFGFYCHNTGTTDIDAGKATFGVSVDNTEVNEFINSNIIKAGDNPSYVNAVADIPETLGIGEHKISVYIKNIEGNKPEGNTKNDILANNFKVYTESFKRQKQLVEQYTSQYCVYCPRGYNVLNTLTEKRNDIAWIAYHCNMSEKDEYTIDESLDFISYACGGSLPSASFNRFYYNDDSFNFNKTIGLSTAYPSNQTEAGATIFSSFLDMSEDVFPSFSSIGISTNYEPTTRQLTVKVSGNIVDNFSSLLGDDAALYVYLTEDGLWGKQKDNDHMRPRYPHDHTLRKALTSYYGDALVATGNMYENTYVTTLDDKWNADNINVVAAIGRPIKTAVNNGVFSVSSSKNDLWIDNAEIVKLKDSTNRINGVADNLPPDNDAQIYTTEGVCVGTSLKALPKGLYIINGKKIVK